MSTLQKQINTMNGKIDGLHQLIEQLTGSLSQVVTEAKSSAGNGTAFPRLGVALDVIIKSLAALTHQWNIKTF
jgi:hypothetical protein